MQYEENLVRSAIEPETMVAAVAQKTVWKMRKAMTGYPASSPTVNFVTKKSGVPMKPPMSVPNMSPKPTIQKAGVPNAKSMTFFMTILPAFLARVRPVSHMAKPGCIKNTSAAPSSTQTVSAEE